jgi:hypothetical protein
MIVAALLVVWGPFAPTDSLYGTVRVVGSGESVPGVRVSVSGTAVSAVSDSAGRYVLHDPRGSRFDVQFERLGFEALTVSVMVADEGDARVDVDLAPSPIRLAPVAVARPLTDSAWSSMNSAAIGELRLTPEIARHNPLVGSADVFAALTTAPTVTGRDELAPSLRVAGGAGDESLVLLDGLPWRGPRPLGGIAGILPSGAVGSVDIQSGVPSARYGNALSSTIDVHPRPADHLTVTGSLDPTTVEQTVGGPLPLLDATVLLSARRTFRAVFVQPDEDGQSSNGFSDLFGRLSMPAAAGTIDLYYLDSRDPLTFPARVQSPPGSQVPTNRFTSSGSLAGAVWTRSLGLGRTATARAWTSGSAADVVWDGRNAASRLQDIGVSADYTSDQSEVGWIVSRTASSYRVRDSTAQGLTLTGAPVIGVVFGTRQWTLLPQWTLSTGVRLGVTPTWGVQIEPRVWTRVVLGDRIAASLGYARIHQYLQSARNEESMLDAVLGADLPIGAGTGGLPPARSEQVTGVVEGRFGARGTVLIEAYSRRLSGLGLVAMASRLPLLVGAVPVGRGSVLGGDATVTYQTHRLDVRAQFGLLAANRSTPVTGYRLSDPSERLAVGVAYRFSHKTVVRTAVWVESGRTTTLVQGGLQFEPVAPVSDNGELMGTPANAPGPLNTAPLPAYSRVDLGVDRDWDFHGVSLGTSLTIVNLLNHSNVLAYLSAPDGRHSVFFSARAVSLRLKWSRPR